MLDFRIDNSFVRFSAKSQKYNGFSYSILYIKNTAFLCVLCLLVKEREYNIDLKDEYYYYRDDLDDEVIKTYGIHGCIVA